MNCKDFLSTIGNTPLIKLRKASEKTGCNIFGKAEFLNPGGSVKDRAAKAIILDALKSGFLKHNGGLLFRKINNNKYEFKAKIKKFHLNRAKITHGGYICSIIDAGAGTAAYTFAKGKTCVTISLEIKFISTTRFKDEIIGSVSVHRKTRSLVFLSCMLKSRRQTIASSSGIWKILNNKIPKIDLKK